MGCTPVLRLARHPPLMPTQGQCVRGWGPLAHGHPCLRDPETWLTGLHRGVGAGRESGGCSCWPPQARIPSFGLCTRPQSVSALWPGAAWSGPPGSARLPGGQGVARGAVASVRGAPERWDVVGVKGDSGGGGGMAPALPRAGGRSGGPSGLRLRPGGFPFLSRHHSSAWPAPSTLPAVARSGRTPCRRANACVSAGLGGGRPGRFQRGSVWGPLGELAQKAHCPLQAFTPPTRWPSERLPSWSRGQVLRRAAGGAGSGPADHSFLPSP